MSLPRFASCSDTAGKQFLAVLVNGQNVAGSPLAVLVTPGAPVAAQSLLQLPAASVSPQVSKPLQFHVIPRDQFGNDDSYSSYFKYYWCRTNINAVGTSGLVSKTLTAGVHHVRVEAHLAWGCYRYGAINTNKAVSITRKSASQSSYTAFNPTFTHTALTEKGTASAAAAEKWSADCPYGQQTEYSSSHLSPLT